MNILKGQGRKRMAVANKLRLGKFLPEIIQNIPKVKGKSDDKKSKKLKLKH